MFVEESQMSIDFLVTTLRNAFFDIVGVEDDQLAIKIHKYVYFISLNSDQKSIRISSVDHIAEYDPALYAMLLGVVNEVNSSMINVCSFILPDDDMQSITLRVDQYVSYSKGLIMEQFVELLRDFEEIDIYILKNYMAKAVHQFEEQKSEDEDYLLN